MLKTEEVQTMGLKKFLSHLVSDDSNHPGDGESSSDATTASEPAQGLAIHPAIDALGRTLRALGDGAFEMDEELGPKYVALAEQVESGATSGLDRIPSKVAENRRLERSWVTRNIRDLAETIVGLVTRLGRNVSLDRSSDLQMEGQLVRLRGAVKQESLNDIRREVLGAVETLAMVMRDRDERQRKEMASISRELERLKTELSHARKEMAVDPLTRLYNRASFDEHLQTCIALAMLAGREACLMMVDIDHFKVVNDTHGHLAGDTVLKAVSDELAKCFPRKSDFVARYGGEEFAVVLSEDGEKVGRMLTQRLLDRIRGTVPVYGEVEIPVTVSVGVAELQPGQTVQEWIATADQRLYEAKRGGRDRFVASPEVS
jgi:diguanylate cyclase (GGDEF)-like protein